MSSLYDFNHSFSRTKYQNCVFMGFSHLFLGPSNWKMYNNLHLWLDESINPKINERHLRYNDQLLKHNAEFFLLASMNILFSPISFPLFLVKHDIML